MVKISLIIILNMFLVYAEINIHNGHCDLTSESCSKPGDEFDDKKLIFYDVNPPEGFNLRRDVYMRFAIMLAEARKNNKHTNWHLVLPPWYNIAHWLTETYLSHDPIPWGHFFDIESLKSYAPVIELDDLLKNSKDLEIDVLFVLQNFENAFENGDFRNKWEIVGPCVYQGDFWGYHNIKAKETLCVKFQGSISQLWELIALHSKRKIMFHHAEIPLHDHYGTKIYWDCRKSMKFNKKLANAAKNYIISNLNCKEEKCSNYLAIHWRRRDFALYKKDVPSIKGTTKQINEIIKNNSLNIKDLYIASDCTFNEFEKLKKQFEKFGFRIHYYMATKEELFEFRDGGVAIIEQIICAHAAYFVGTHDSTFTYRIQEEREVIGFDSSTTFNRLCPDVGPCEKPSRWTIVH